MSQLSLRLCRAGLWFVITLMFAGMAVCDIIHGFYKARRNVLKTYEWSGYRRSRTRRSEKAKNTLRPVFWFFPYLLRGLFIESEDSICNCRETFELAESEKQDTLARAAKMDAAITQKCTDQSFSWPQWVQPSMAPVPLPDVCVGYFEGILSDIKTWRNRLVGPHSVRSETLQRWLLDWRCGLSSWSAPSSKSRPRTEKCVCSRGTISDMRDSAASRYAKQWITTEQRSYNAYRLVKQGSASMQAGYGNGTYQPGACGFYEGSAVSILPPLAGGARSAANFRCGEASWATKAAGRRRLLSMQSRSAASCSTSSTRYSSVIWSSS